MSIAISGATGQLGRLVIEKLKSQINQGEIIALARSPQKAEGLGVEVREADYAKPEGLVRALEGVSTLLLISSSEVGQRFTQHRHVIDAAKQQGVQRIIYTSLLHADKSQLALAGEHRETERYLKESGVAYTILRNGWYTENYTGSIPGALASGAFVGSAGEGRISAAPRVDFAEAAVAALLGDGHAGKTYELAGDEAWTLAELAQEISRQTGKQIPYKNLPEAEYAQLLVQIGLPEAFAQVIAGSDTGASEGALLHEGKELSKLIGRPTTKLSISVAEALK